MIRRLVLLSAVSLNWRLLREWEMTPQTVNAYYDPSLNVIVFRAGILQPPFFGADAPATWNYGAVGTAPAPAVSRQWHALQRARVPGGLRHPRGEPDGARESLQALGVSLREVDRPDSGRVVLPRSRG